jgi:predicted ATPase
MSQKLVVVVTGGTGKQGSAVVRSLLERGHEVRAITRSTDSAKAAIGREFSYGVIAAVATVPEKNLKASLIRLVGAELIFQRGVPPDATYEFKHVLVQDAAYSTLLRSGRQKLHGRIAHILEEQFSETVVAQPELLARHFTEAGLLEQGVVYWQRAGERATERSANLEAVEHLQRGLAVIEAFPDRASWAKQELRLLTGRRDDYDEIVRVAGNRGSIRARTPTGCRDRPGR